MSDKRRKSPPVPSVPEEVITVPELGISVKVRGLLLRDRLALAVSSADDSFEGVARLLSLSVVHVDTGEPVYTAAEWEQWGASNFNAALDLFNKASMISGLTAAKTEEQPKN